MALTSTPKFMLRRAGDGGPAWREVPRVPAMTVQAECPNTACQFHSANIDAMADAQGLPANHPSRCILAHVDNDFFVFSRDEEWPDYKAELVNILCPRTALDVKRCAKCPQCAGAVYQRGGLALKTIGFTCCQFRIHYEWLSGGGSQAKDCYVPEFGPGEDAAFLSVGQGEHCTLTWPMFSTQLLCSGGLFGEVNIELRSHPPGLTAYGVCNAGARCAISRANMCLQSSSSPGMRFPSVHALGTDGSLTLKSEAGRVVAEEALQCDHCETAVRRRDLQSVSMVRCQWRVKTGYSAEASRPWIFSCSAPGRLDEVNLSATRLFQETSWLLFPLCIECRPITERGFLVQGVCSNGGHCPLQAASLKKVLPPHAYAACCELATAVFEETKPTKSPFFSEVIFDNPFKCGACSDAGREGTLDPTFVICYRMNYEIRFLDNNKIEHRLPADPDLVLAADGASGYDLAKFAADNNCTTTGIAFLPIIVK